jgi:hypothetical protein
MSIEAEPIPAICYLIGTNHAHQLEGDKNGDSVAFAAYLTAFCSDNRIDLMAEELNEQAITRWKAQGSVVRSVASRLSICHLFCDPGREDRQRLGLLTDMEAAKKLGYELSWTQEQDAAVKAEARGTWPARERFWLDHLRQVPFNRCAFVLGAEHVQTFGSLLSSEGFTVHVAQSHWKP